MKKEKIKKIIKIVDFIIKGIVLYAMSIFVVLAILLSCGCIKLPFQTIMPNALMFIYNCIVWFFFMIYNIIPWLIFEKDATYRILLICTCITATVILLLSYIASYF